MYIAISCLTSVIHSWKSDVPHENTNWERVSHVFKWEKLQCITSTQNPQPIS